MGDRPGSSSRVRMSEDKVRRKDLCWSVRAVYILEKLSDVSGPGLGEAGRYSLRIAVELGVKCLYVYGDSALVINQLNKDWIRLTKRWTHTTNRSES